MPRLQNPEWRESGHRAGESLLNEHLARWGLGWCGKESFLKHKHKHVIFRKQSFIQVFFLFLFPPSHICTRERGFFTWPSCADMQKLNAIMGCLTPMDIWVVRQYIFTKEAFLHDSCDWNEGKKNNLSQKVAVLPLKDLHRLTLSIVLFVSSKKSVFSLKSQSIWRRWDLSAWDDPSLDATRGSLLRRPPPPPLFLPLYCFHLVIPEASGWWRPTCKQGLMEKQR